VRSKAQLAVQVHLQEDRVRISLHPSTVDREPWDKFPSILRWVRRDQQGLRLIQANFYTPGRTPPLQCVEGQLHASCDVREFRTPDEECQVVRIDGDFQPRNRVECFLNVIHVNQPKNGANDAPLGEAFLEDTLPAFDLFPLNLRLPIR
jgi:hypothetical protein